MVWEFKSTPTDAVWSELGLTIQNGEISIRDEMVQALQSHGHEVFVRKPTNRRCDCYKDGAFNEAEINCPNCNGFGYYYLDTKVRSYRRPAFGTFGFTGGAVRTAFGDLTAADTVWYFPTSLPVTVGYIIVEVVNDENGLAVIPYKIERKHTVKLAHLYREQLGRTEYWVVLSRELKLGK